MKDTELLNITVKGLKYILRGQSQFHNGEPDKYLKRGYESYQAEDYGDMNTYMLYMSKTLSYL